MTCHPGRSEAVSRDPDRLGPGQVLRTFRDDNSDGCPFSEHLWTAPPWQEILVGHLQVGR